MTGTRSSLRRQQKEEPASQGINMSSQGESSTQGMKKRRRRPPQTRSTKARTALPTDEYQTKSGRKIEKPSQSTSKMSGTTSRKMRKKKAPIRATLRTVTNEPRSEAISPVIYLKPVDESHPELFRRAFNRYIEKEGKLVFPLLVRLSEEDVRLNTTQKTKSKERTSTNNLNLSTAKESKQRKSNFPPRTFKRTRENPPTSLKTEGQKQPPLKKTRSNKKQESEEEPRPTKQNKKKSKGKVGKSNKAGKSEAKAPTEKSADKEEDKSLPTFPVSPHGSDYGFSSDRTSPDKDIGKSSSFQNENDSATANCADCQQEKSNLHTEEQERSDDHTNAPSVPPDRDTPESSTLPDESPPIPIPILPTDKTNYTLPELVNYVLILEGWKRDWDPNNPNDVYQQLKILLRVKTLMEKVYGNVKDDLEMMENNGKIHTKKYKYMQKERYHLKKLFQKVTTGIQEYKTVAWNQILKEMQELEIPD